MVSGMAGRIGGWCPAFRSITDNGSVFIGGAVSIKNQTDEKVGDRGAAFSGGACGARPEVGSRFGLRPNGLKKDWPFHCL